MKFNYMWIVLKKELLDSFRDKKTIILGLLIPLLILPVLSVAMKKGMNSIEEGETKPLDIAIIYDAENRLVNYLEESKDIINILTFDEPLEALKENKIKAIIKINDDFEKNISNDNIENVEIIYDNSTQSSSIARGRILDLLDRFSDVIAEERLNNLGINPQILNVVHVKSSGIEKQNGQGLMMISMLLPLMLSIWSASGGIAAATDLGAGEKERQTLEPLLTTNISRLSLLLGKYFAIVIMGIMGTTSALIGYFISSKINPDFVGGGVTISIASIFVIALFCIGLTLSFSAIEFAISTYARNFKEAQTYLAPVPILVMIPAYFTMFLDGKSIPNAYLHIPVINTISIIKEAIISVFNPTHILIVSGWTVIYVAVSILFTVKMFNKESVIFRN